MWKADKLIYNGDDSYVMAYQGNELVWAKITESNVIYYTSSDGQIIEASTSSSTWGAEMVSNTYTDDGGVMIFDGPVTKVYMMNTTKLTSITIPSAVEIIDLRNNSVLTSVVINSPLIDRINSYCFYDCVELVSVVLPSTVTRIDESAFRNCYKLSSINWTNRLTLIGKSAFANCYELTINNIPLSVTSLGDYAFSGCSKLSTNLTIPSSIKTIGGGVFQDCSSLVNVIIRNGITLIDAYAFSGCSNLETISIPESVTSLGQFAFQSCRKLVSITIPKSVKTIGRYCFSGYSGLEEAIVNATVPPTLGVDAFTNNSGSLKYIKVPRASLNQYKKASGWSDYADKIVAQ